MSLDLSKIRILVVDDNDFMRDLVASMLREIGFREISHASDGEAALAKVRIVEPHLIICDIDMEPMDGLDFVENLRKQADPNQPRIPVLMLSARNESKIVQWLIKHGINGYLVKPVKKSQLEARVLTILERSFGVSN